MLRHRNGSGECENWRKGLGTGSYTISVGIGRNRFSVRLQRTGNPTSSPVGLEGKTIAVQCYCMNLVMLFSMPDGTTRRRTFPGKRKRGKWRLESPSRNVCRWYLRSDERGSTHIAGRNS